MSNSYTGLAPYLAQADAIAISPLPPAVKKTALRRFWESALAQDAKAALASPTGVSVVSTALAGSEGAGVGYLLGVLAGGSHSKYAGVAAAAVAGGGLAASLIPGNPIAEHCRNIGVAGTAVLAYRQGEAKKRAETPKVAGESGPDDPTDHIIALAKKLGIE